jgi:hypothetical protein
MNRQGDEPRAAADDSVAIDQAAADHAATELRKTWVGAGVLLGALASATAAALLLGPERPEWAAAVGFAAVITGVANLGGWFVGRRQPSSPGDGVVSALGGTALRILLPLIALAWQGSSAPSLVEAGGRALLVGFYLLLLATTILLTIIQGRQGR